MDVVDEIKRNIENAIFDLLPENANKEWISLSFEKTQTNNDAFKTLLEPCRHLLSSGGKRWRPLLLSLCANAIATKKNARCEIADFYKLAALVELVHNASLIHDDIEDASNMRRGKKATHLAFGLDVALNAGSFLYFEAATAIKKINANDETKKVFFDLYLNELRTLHLGQAADIFWHRNETVFPRTSEYREMVQNKTGTLSSLAVRLGFFAGGETLENANVAGNVAREIGEAFQIIDDVKNLTTGNPGKKRGDDIVEGKKSLPVLLHVEKNPRDKEQIANFFKDAKANGIASSAVENCILLLEKSGSIGEANEIGKKLLEKKTNEFLQFFENENDKAKIKKLLKGIV